MNQLLIEREYKGTKIKAVASYIGATVTGIEFPNVPECFEPHADLVAFIERQAADELIEASRED